MIPEAVDEGKVQRALPVGRALVSAVRSRHRQDRGGQAVAVGPREAGVDEQGVALAGDDPLLLVCHAVR
ncbi:hypothetical protein GCM10010359_32920 [Streptomyces morookaense]|nr:hypothetical protein GCM10010359_32920 [Streptomyces morookaense]